MEISYLNRGVVFQEKLESVSRVDLQETYTLNISYSWDHLITRQKRELVKHSGKKKSTPVCIFHHQFFQPKESVLPANNWEMRGGRRAPPCEFWNGLTSERFKSHRNRASSNYWFSVQWSDFQSPGLPFVLYVLSPEATKFLFPCCIRQLQLFSNTASLLEHLPYTPLLEALRPAHLLLSEFSPHVMMWYLPNISL